MKYMKEYSEGQNNNIDDYISKDNQDNLSSQTKKYDLKKLIEKITPENLHPES